MITLKVSKANVVVIEMDDDGTVRNINVNDSDLCLQCGSDIDECRCNGEPELDETGHIKDEDWLPYAYQVHHIGKAEVTIGFEDDSK